MWHPCVAPSARISLPALTLQIKHGLEARRSFTQTTPKKAQSLEAHIDKQIILKFSALHPLEEH